MMALINKCHPSINLLIVSGSTPNLSGDVAVLVESFNRFDLHCVNQNLPSNSKSGSTMALVSRYIPMVFRLYNSLL